MSNLVTPVAYSMFINSMGEMSRDGDDVSSVNVMAACAAHPTLCEREAVDAEFASQRRKFFRDSREVALWTAWNALSDLNDWGFFRFYARLDFSEAGVVIPGSAMLRMSFEMVLTEERLAVLRVAVEDALDASLAVERMFPGDDPGTFQYDINLDVLGLSVGEVASIQIKILDALDRLDAASERVFVL